MKKLTVTLFAAVLLFMGAGGFLSTTTAQSSEGDVSITITEYSDYQCPACAYFHPIVEKLKAEYGDTLKVEYKYFPLNSHQYAALAARAAEAAGNQGEFKAMHDMLFENQEAWSRSGNPQSVFIGYAEKIGLDVALFKDELNASETQKVVMEEKQEGRNMGVNSTPTFIVNGSMLQNLPRTYQEFKSIIDSYIEN